MLTASFKWASSLMDKLEKTRPFTENEAWTLFKLAAFSEAIGWTLLITGISIRYFGLPGKDIAVPIAGQIHGTIFLAYFGVLAAIYSSLGWSRKKFLLAVLAGVPPYGSLIFERWMAHDYQKTKLRHLASLALMVCL